MEGSVISDTLQQLTFQLKKNDKEFKIFVVYARRLAMERLEL